MNEKQITRNHWIVIILNTYHHLCNMFCSYILWLLLNPLKRWIVDMAWGVPLPQIDFHLLSNLKFFTSSPTHTNLGKYNSSIPGCIVYQGAKWNRRKRERSQIRNICSPKSWIFWIEPYSSEKSRWNENIM